MWWRRYESPTFQADCEALWQQVKPVYEELHAYVRYKLRQQYSQIGENDPIPAQLFGESSIIRSVFMFFKLKMFNG